MWSGRDVDVMVDEASPTAKALLALELIQTSPGISGARLATRLGVSDRAARRYVSTLRDADIPIESTPGRDGGYRLGRGFRVPPLMFSTEEALGLVMAVLRGGQPAGDVSDPVGRALSKIIRVLPAPMAEPANALRHVSTRDSDGQETNPTPETATLLVQACAVRRRVRLGYRLRLQDEFVMEVDPWAVSVRHGRWYLLCWSHTRDARRVLRVDRISAIEVLADTFVPPPDLDAAQAVEEHMAQGWRYEVEVIIDAPLAKAEHWVPRSRGRLEAIDADHTRLVGTTDSPPWYVQRLVDIEAPFRILGSPEVVAFAARAGRRLLEAAGPQVGAD